MDLQQPIKYVTLSVSLLLFVSLAPACSADQPDHQQAAKQTKKNQNMANVDSAYFASGCFWCVEEIYEKVKGVKEAVSGYAGGSKSNPSYNEVAGGQTNHTETVKVYYNPDEVDFKTLLKVYYGSQDPTTVGQAPDFGQQYRSIIFYTNEQEKQIAKAFKESIASSGKYDEPIVTEIKKLDAFWKATEYHQDYVKKNPNKGYVRKVSKPRFQSFRKKYPELVKEKYKE
ncbi:MAG: peptide-methionine (S)-S-oxide reductase [Bacteroidetes bacterium SW_11_45_7]|nr:MAG: peptide-methionine (S)-S-oxide reductase [Bacteroidetes bacterium SW_11_45_7]